MALFVVSVQHTIVFLRTTKNLIELLWTLLRKLSMCFLNDCVSSCRRSRSFTNVYRIQRVTKAQDLSFSSRVSNTLPTDISFAACGPHMTTIVAYLFLRICDSSRHFKIVLALFSRPRGIYANWICLKRARVCVWCTRYGHITAKQTACFTIGV